MTEISRRGVLPNVGYKSPVAVATIAPITLFGPQTINTVVLVPGDRVLVKDQADTTENGIYNVQAGDWTRSVDFDDRDDVVNGTQVLETHTSLIWRASFTGTYIPGTTVITFPAVVFADGPVIILNSLPTADPLVAGQIWNNLGVLNISSG